MNLFLNNQSSAPIYEQIYTQLKNQILSGELPEDTALPSIRALAKDLRISVITTKRAYEELERDGLIYTLAGKGSFVAARNQELLREEHLREIEQHFRAALQLAHDPDPRVAFRASAALEYAYFANPDGLRPYQEQFLANFLTAASTSAQRHYAKVLENLIRSGRITLSSAQMQQVAEAAFDRMIDPRARPAVKVWSMEILFLLAPALPWVDEQLEESVRMLMDAGSPALDAHGARLCRKIGKRRGR